MGTQEPEERRFSLEWRERTVDGEQTAKDHRKNTQVMDSTYQADQAIPLDVITINCDFVRGITGTADTADDRNRYDVGRLFTAVSRGDMGELQGLQEYLRVTGKHLSNKEYQPHGKSALHKALLNLQNGRNDTVELMLNITEESKLKKFVNIANETPEYMGQTALHIAIERRSLPFVKLLMEKGADVQAKACGTCFQQHHKHGFYFGELPLSLAACTNQTEIVDFLLTNQHQQADVCDTDSQGNTVLHALVVLADDSAQNHNTDLVIKMYDHILTKVARLKPELKLEEKENKDGLSPIHLAARTGKFELLKHMLHREFNEREWKHLSRKFTEFTYGPVCSSLYDLSSLDTYERNSVLEIVVYGHGIPNRLEMLQVEPINQLLEDKWERFARCRFIFSFVLYALYLCLISLVAFLRKDGSPGQPSLDYFLLPLLLVLFCVSAGFWLTGLGFLVKCHMWGAFKDRFFELLFFTQAALLLAFVILSLSGKEYLHCLVLSLTLSWVNLLFYFRGYKRVGIYCVLIQKMIYEDLVYFLLVYIIFLSGFSAAFVTLQKDPEKPTPEPNQMLASALSLFFSTALELFRLTIGMGELEYSEQYRYPWVFYVLLLSYIVLTFILLLNTLIAFMNKTMEEMSELSTHTWRLQRAITILDIERCLLCFKDKLRSGEKFELAKGNTDDWRWCFRATEIRWRTNTGVLEEDPDNQNPKKMTSPPSTTSRSHTQRGAEAATATPSG